jgi:1,2-diacylglycerol 3-alpha-glucosyltransferase
MCHQALLPFTEFCHERGSALRILMISDVYFPRINGVSTSIQTFRRELGCLGHESWLIAPWYPERCDDDDATIHRIPSRGVPRDPEDRMMRRSAIRRLLPRLREADFDVVHIQTPFLAHYAGLEIAGKLGLPVVETYHTYFEEYLYHYVPFVPRGLMRFVARHFTRSQANRVHTLIAPSRPMQEALEKYGIATPVTVIPTGLEEDRFHLGDGAAFRARLGIAPKAPVVVHVGRIAHEKNIDFLLRVFARVLCALPEALLLIAGEGPAREHCRQLVAELEIGKAAHFVGYLKRDRDLLDCYRAGNVFAFASRTETQGLVLLEAMAQGVPVVSTACMGTLDVLGPRRGCLIAPEDEEAFAGMLLNLLKDSEARSRLGAEAVAYAATWSSRDMARRLADLYGGTVERAIRSIPVA